MPGIKWCQGWRRPEDWVMRRCPFCEEYFQARKISGPRTRAASISTMESMESTMDARNGYQEYVNQQDVNQQIDNRQIDNQQNVVASGIAEEPVTTREKASIKRTFLPKHPSK